MSPCAPHALFLHNAFATLRSSYFDVDLGAAGWGRQVGDASPAGCVSGSVVAALGPGPLHAALVCQHCLRGRAGRGCTSRPVVALMWGAGMQEAYACMHDSPGIKREHLSPMPKLGKGQHIPLTSMVKLAIQYETLPPPLFELAVGWHARGMVMELSRVSLSNLSFASP